MRFQRRRRPPSRVFLAGPVAAVVSCTQDRKWAGGRPPGASETVGRAGGGAHRFALPARWVWGLWNPTAVYSTWPLTFIAPAFAQRMHREVRRLRSSSWLSRPCARATMWGRLSHGHLTGRIEAWETNGARYSLVYRYPLLDRRVVEFCLGIPVEQFYQQRLKRSLFRRAFAGTLPASLLSGEAKPLEPAWMEVVRTVILPTWRM